MSVTSSRWALARITARSRRMPGRPRRAWRAKRRDERGPGDELVPTRALDHAWSAAGRRCTGPGRAASDPCPSSAHRHAARRQRSRSVLSWVRTPSRRYRRPRGIDSSRPARPNARALPQAGGRQVRGECALAGCQHRRQLPRGPVRGCTVDQVDAVVHAEPATRPEPTLDVALRAARCSDILEGDQHPLSTGHRSQRSVQPVHASSDPRGRRGKQPPTYPLRRSAKPPVPAAHDGRSCPACAAGCRHRAGSRVPAADEGGLVPHVPQVRGGRRVGATERR